MDGNKSGAIFGFDSLAGKVKEEMATQQEVTPNPVLAVPMAGTGERKSIQLSKRVGVQNVKGLALESLLDELVKPIIYSINKEKINSFNSSVLGDLTMALSRVPRGLKKVYYDWCDQYFYVVKNAARESLVYDIVKDAALNSVDNTFRLPFVSERRITIDPNYGGTDVHDSVKPCELDVMALTFTEEEINYLDFAFIENVELDYDPSSEDPYKNAFYVFTVDKRLIQVAPFDKGES